MAKFYKILIKLIIKFWSSGGQLGKRFIETALRGADPNIFEVCGPIYFLNILARRRSKPFVAFVRFPA